MEYIGQIYDDWKSSSSSNHQKPSSGTADGAHIQLILIDDSRNQHSSFNNGLFTTLKTLFNNYAKKRCVSLRSLWFLYHGKTLFLSSVGNKSPEKLNMHDRVEIVVHDNTSESQEPSSSVSSNKMSTILTYKKIKTRHCPKNIKGRGKRMHIRQEESTKTLDEYKALHSKTLHQTS